VAKAISLSCRPNVGGSCDDLHTKAAGQAEEDVQGGLGISANILLANDLLREFFQKPKLKGRTP
jgi:hypothetical protein